jgi:hypothetical protein
VVIKSIETPATVPLDFVKRWSKARETVYNTMSFGNLSKALVERDHQSSSASSTLALKTLCWAVPDGVSTPVADGFVSDDTAPLMVLSPASLPPVMFFSFLAFRLAFFS